MDGSVEVDDMVVVVGSIKIKMSNGMVACMVLGD